MLHVFGGEPLARMFFSFILRGSVVDPDYALTLGLVHELADHATARGVELW